MVINMKREGLESSRHYPRNQPTEGRAEKPWGSWMVSTKSFPGVQLLMSLVDVKPDSANRVSMQILRLLDGRVEIDPHLHSSRSILYAVETGRKRLNLSNEGAGR